MFVWHNTSFIIHIDPFNEELMRETVPNYTLLSCYSTCQLTATPSSSSSVGVSDQFDKEENDCSEKSLLQRLVTLFKSELDEKYGNIVILYRGETSKRSLQCKEVMLVAYIKVWLLNKTNLRMIHCFNIPAVHVSRHTVGLQERQGWCICMISSTACHCIHATLVT